jgi:hypothetical protein
MNRNLKILLFGLLFIWASCDKEKNSPPSEFTLDSTPDRGFLFEGLKIIEYTNASTVKPDFIVLAQVNAQGDVISPFLSHPDYLHRFILSEEFTNLDEAQAYYDTYSTPDNKPLQLIASNIKPYQVWLVKTNNEGFGKILVINTRIDKIDNTPFAEVTFKAAKM